MTHHTAPLPIIGAACGLGAPDHRCGSGPQALRQALQASPRPELLWRELIDCGLVAEGETAALQAFLARLAEACAAALNTADRIAVVGGDHACAMGTWRGVRQAVDAPLGLIWIDAHLDAHTPASSPSGRWHGMPVADLLGQCHPGEAGVIDPRHLCLVGVRSYEGAERELLQGLGVRVITMKEIQRRGFDAAMAEAVEIASRAPAFGVSIDLDALDPGEAPGVGSPVVGGLHAAELLAWLPRLAAAPRLRAVELAEFNPVIDVEQRTLKLVLQMLTLASGGSHESDH